MAADYLEEQSTGNYCYAGDSMPIFPILQLSFMNSPALPGLEKLLN